MLDQDSFVGLSCYQLGPFFIETNQRNTDVNQMEIGQKKKLKIWNKQQMIKYKKSGQPKKHLRRKYFGQMLIVVQQLLLQELFISSF